MDLIINDGAQKQMLSVSKWIEKRNTIGSGDRWLKKLREDLIYQASIGVQYAICQNDKLAKLNFRCFTYNDNWVVAYKIRNDRFVIYRFTLGAKLR